METENQEEQKGDPTYKKMIEIADRALKEMEELLLEKDAAVLPFNPHRALTFFITRAWLTDIQRHKADPTLVIGGVAEIMIYPLFQLSTRPGMGSLIERISGMVLEGLQQLAGELRVKGLLEALNFNEEDQNVH